MAQLWKLINNCTEESLEKERAADINNAQRKLAKREKELTEAERDGDPEKLEKRRRQIEEARSELAEAEKPIAR